MMKLSFDAEDTKKRIVKIPKTYKLLFCLFFNGLIFAALFYFLIMPQLEIKRQLNEEHAKLKQQLENMVAIKNNMDKFRKEYVQLQELLQQMLKQLPETKDIPNLLRNVSSVGNETRLKIIYFEPKPVQNKEFYAELPFSVKFSGPFHNVRLLHNPSPSYFCILIVTFYVHSISLG